VCSGAAQKQANSNCDDNYKSVIESIEQGATIPKEIRKAIDKDLHRTFPENFPLQGVELIPKLSRILQAYSLRNPSWILPRNEFYRFYIVICCL